MATEPHSDAEFVREHESLVRKLAARTKNEFALTTDLDDLMAYGFKGLLEAKERFDPGRGVKFTTFAYYRIRGAILDGVRTMAYLPRRVHDARKAAESFDRAAQEVAFARAERPEQRTDLAATLEAFDEILTKTSAAYVLSVVGQAEEQHDAPPDELLISRQERERVLAALEILDERARTLVVGYYLEDRTLEDMSQEMGISKSWASRITSRALLKLREHLEP